jgi:hypothetical protein
MAGFQANAIRIDKANVDYGPVGVVSELDRRRDERASCPELPLRCVSSGYLSNGCSCPATVPMAVVASAWRLELEHSGSHADRFFRFAWREGTWLAYGLSDGRIRGVYCPEHSAEREQRAALADGPGDAPVLSLVMGA